MCEIGVGKHGEVVVDGDIVGIKLVLLVRGAHAIKIVEKLGKVWTSPTTVSRHCGPLLAGWF